MIPVGIGLTLTGSMCDLIECGAVQKTAPLHFDNGGEKTSLLALGITDT